MEIKLNRIQLLLNCIKKESIHYNNTDPISKLISNYNDITKILKMQDKLKVSTFFSFHKEIIHNILYEYEEVINIKTDEQKKRLDYNFYLNLLINDNLEVINYSFPVDYIININNEREKIEDKYKLIFISKCIIDLIYNFKGTDEFNDDENQKILIKIENENKNIIKNNIEVFNTINLDLDEKNIESIKIDELYILLIKSLIINRIFDDYEYTCNILNQIELIKINLTKDMFDELFTILDEKKEYIIEYLILEKEDLFNEKKINFYYILLKYILKNPIYIYQFKFLIKTKKIILEQLRLNELYSININKNFNEKFQYIVKILLDSDFYWSKYLNNIKEKLKEVNKYYKEYLFESKKEDINYINEIIKSNDNANNVNDFEKYLKDYKLAKKMNLRLPIINYLYSEKNILTIKNEEKFNKEVSTWEQIEKMILEHKIKKIAKNIKELLFKYFNDNNNKEIILKIFNKNEYEFFIKEFNKSYKSLNEGNNQNDKNKNIINEEGIDDKINKNINIQNKKIKIKIIINKGDNIIGQVEKKSTNSTGYQNKEKKEKSENEEKRVKKEKRFKKEKEEKKQKRQKKEKEEKLGSKAGILIEVKKEKKLKNDNTNDNNNNENIKEGLLIEYLKSDCFKNEKNEEEKNQKYDFYSEYIISKK